MRSHEYLSKKLSSLMPCLFSGIYFSGNHFPHFSMFGKHKESWSRKMNSGQRKN